MTANFKSEGKKIFQKENDRFRTLTAIAGLCTINL